MSTLPRRFGNYMLLERLARGGMGEIFLSQKAGVTGANRYVALKTLRQDLTRDDEYVTRFLDEARVAIVLNHPVINKVFDVGFAEGTYFLELEYISGRDVRSLLDRARDLERQVPPEIVYYVVGELLDALGYLHQAKDLSGQSLKLIHRDVSPQNLMVSWQGDIRLIDFGLARFAARTTATEPGMVLGKLRYMAPEQARGHDIDHRVDLFAVGVMLYELLSGRRLYDDVDPNQLWSIVARGLALEGVKRALLPPAMVPVVERALAVDPAQRFANAGEFLQALRSQARWSHPEARAGLEGLLADLFEVDLTLEREFMQQLGRMAPFELSSDESTHSYSLAAPAAAVVADVVESTQMSGPAALHEAPTGQRAAVEDTPALLARLAEREPTGPLAVDDQVAAGLAAPAARTETEALPQLLREETFIVARTGEHPAPTIRPAAPVTATPRPPLRPGAVPPTPAAAAPLRAGVLPSGDGAPRSRLLLLAVAGLGAAAAGGLLWFALGRAPATGDGMGTAVTLVTPPVDRAVDAALPPRGVDAAPATPDSPPATRDVAPPADPPVPAPTPEPVVETPEPARRPGGHSKRPPRSPHNPVPPEPVPPATPPPERDPAPSPHPAEPRPAVATTPRVERPRGFSAEASSMIRELDRALGHKGLLPDDAMELWPVDYRAARALATDDAQRAVLVDRLKGQIRDFSYRRSFINGKLARVQAAYASVRPLLSTTSQMFRDLEAQNRAMLEAYRVAGNDPARLEQANRSMNLMLLRLREARR